MVKNYTDWLNERDLSSPISIEIEAGDIKVYADPQAENWIGETVRTELYEELEKKFEKALEDEDDTKIRELLQTVRDMPLFSQDQSNVWKMTQVDGVEKFRSEAEYRRFLAGYVVKKIKYFLDWARNSEGKKTN